MAEIVLVAVLIVRLLCDDAIFYEQDCYLVVAGLLEEQIGLQREFLTGQSGSPTGRGHCRQGCFPLLDGLYGDRCGRRYVVVVRNVFPAVDDAGRI